MTAALTTPLVFAIATAPPFAAETRAQGPSRMFGPLFPATAGSDNIAPSRSGNAITIPSRWSCGDTTSNVISLSNPDGGGRFMTAARDNGLLNQSLTITSVVGGTPRQFSYLETRLGVTRASGAISLTDANADGVPDGVNFTGTVSGAASLAFTPASDYVSIPWAQASALGVDTSTTCAGAVPQVWIPLADTNGDGRGDSIVMDLDGNGVADGDVFRSPAVVVPAVPAMGPVTRFILMMLIGLVGAWFLSRRGPRSLSQPPLAH